MKENRITLEFSVLVAAAPRNYICFPLWAWGGAMTHPSLVHFKSRNSTGGG